MKIHYKQLAALAPYHQEYAVMQLDSLLVNYDLATFAKK